MVVENIGVSTDGLAERLIPQGQGVGVLDDLLAPARKQPQGVLIKRDGLVKISRRLGQVEGRRGCSAVSAANLKNRWAFGSPI